MPLTKIDDRGLTTPIDLQDNEQIRLGTGNDLRIYHNGTHSYIEDAGAGRLNIATNQLNVTNSASTETLINALEDGAVKLYHNNTLKFETSTQGADITGGLLVDIVDPVLNVASVYDYKYGYHAAANTQHAVTVRGNEAAIEVLASDQSYHAGSIILRGGNEGFAFINNSSDDKLELINFTAAGNGFSLHNGGSALSNYKKNLIVNKDGSVELYHNASKKFETTSSGISVTGVIEPTGSIKLDDDRFIYFGTGDDMLIGHQPGTPQNVFRSTDGATKMIFQGGSETMAVMYPQAQVELYYDNSKKFETASHGVTFFGTSFHGDNVVSAFGASSDLQIYHNGSDSIITDSGTGNLALISNGAEIQLLGASGGDYMLRGISNGAVELYHDNSKKFETSSVGGTLTGVLSVSSNIRVSGEIDLGTANGNKFMDVCLGDNYAFHLRSTSGEGQNHENLARFHRNGSVDLFHDANLKLSTTSSGISVTGTVAATSFSGDGSNLTGITSTTINGNANDRIITGSGTANTLQGESNLTFDGNRILTVSTDGHAYGTLNLDGNSGGLIQFEDNDTLIWEIYTNTTELSIYDRVTGQYSTKFKAGGNVEIEDGNLKFNGAGHGIDFSADGNAGGTTSELFHDYEEGSFDIVAGSGSSVTFTSGNNKGSYTKIGRQVTIAGQLRINSGSGNVRIDLPFNSASNTNDEDMTFAASILGYDYNAQNGSDCDGLFIAVDANSSYARFLEHRDNNPWTSLDGDAGAYLRFTITYFTDS